MDAEAARHISVTVVLEDIGMMDVVKGKRILLWVYP
jgi:hypothetical protein